MIGVAEIYDALTTTRPYRQLMAPDHAVEHLKTVVGTTIGPVEWGPLAAVVARREALVFVVDSTGAILRRGPDRHDPRLTRLSPDNSIA